MFKNSSVLFLVALSILAAGSASGGIPDSAPGAQSGEKTLSDAVSRGDSLLTAVSLMISKSPDSAKEVVAAAVKMNSDLAGEIVYAAIMAGGDPWASVFAAVSAAPARAGSIVSAAIGAAPDSEDAIVQAALKAGARESTVMAAVVAGRMGGLKGLKGGIGNIETPNRGLGGVGVTTAGSPS